MTNPIESVRFSFLYVDVYSFGRTWVYPESVVPYNMLRYILTGEAIFFMDGEEFRVKKDQIVYVPRGCRLSCHALTDNFSFSSIRFTTSVYYEGGNFLADYYGIPKITENKDEKQYFEQIYSWVKTENIARMFFVRGNLELLIGSLVARSRQEQGAVSRVPESEEYNLEMVKRRIRKSDNKIDSRDSGSCSITLPSIRGSGIRRPRWLRWRSSARPGSGSCSKARRGNHRESI